MYEYWIGKGINYDKIWDAYDKGSQYIQKYHSMRVYLIRLTFNQHSIDLPLFNFEAVYKTVKGYFHDLKQLCFNQSEYESAGPLFLYSVERASGIWTFVGELRQLILLGTTLADEKAIGEKLDNWDRKFQLLHKYFGESISKEDFDRFMNAGTPRQIDGAVKHLIAQKIEKVEISREPFDGDIQHTQSTLIDIKRLLKESAQDS